MSKRVEREVVAVKMYAAVLVAAAIFVVGSLSYTAEREILKEGILGAGTGAVAGLAAGAKGKDLWKGALAGAGVNIVGGALLDAISGEQVASVDQVQTMDSKDAYSQGYKDGFNNGYKQGYTEGYKDGVKEQKSE